MDAVDKGDAAQFTLGEILHPTGWVLLNFLMDPRTGLGRFRDFRISNYQLMMQLIDVCTTTERGGDPRAAGRRRARRPVLRARRAGRRADQALRDRARQPRGARPPRRGGHPPDEPLHDLRAVPLCNISIHVLWGLKQQNTVFATGKSIIDRCSRTNVGELMLAYGGGGHEAAGTCQVENDDAERVLGELVGRITSDG